MGQQQIHIIRSETTHNKGIYLNGQLVFAGDDITLWKLLEALGFSVTSEFVDEEWFTQENGCCPTTLPHENVSA